MARVSRKASAVTLGRVMLCDHPFCTGCEQVTCFQEDKVPATLPMHVLQQATPLAGLQQAVCSGCQGWRWQLCVCSWVSSCLKRLCTCIRHLEPCSMESNPSLKLQATTLFSQHLILKLYNSH